MGYNLRGQVGELGGFPLGERKNGEVVGFGQGSDGGVEVFKVGAGF